MAWLASCRRECSGAPVPRGGARAHVLPPMLKALKLRAARRQRINTLLPVHCRNALRLIETEHRRMPGRLQPGARGDSPCCIRPAIHHTWLRCSSVAYAQYASSSRLAPRAPRPSRCNAGFHHGLLDGPKLPARGRRCPPPCLEARSCGTPLHLPTPPDRPQSFAPDPRRSPPHPRATRHVRTLAHRPAPRSPFGARHVEPPITLDDHRPLHRPQR